MTLPTEADDHSRHMQGHEQITKLMWVDLFPVEMPG